MPFPIWCTTCQPHPIIIGQGVRFNAEKKKIGNYYSTPIYSFRMKHTICGGWIEIQTDPKNTAYVVISGAKKRDTGEDKDAEVGDIKIRTAEERERLENDPFAALDVKVEDRRLALSAKTRVESLKKLRDRHWSDPYEHSKRLRKAFRADRNARQKNATATEELKDRMGLGIELLDEVEEDRQRAKLVDFERVDSDTLVARARSRPLFVRGGESGGVAQGTSGGNKESSRLPSKVPAKNASRKPAVPLTVAQESRERLHRELRDNTRAAIDPFLVEDKDWSSALSNGVSSNSNKPLIPAVAVKRKREEDSGAPESQPDRVGSKGEGDSKSLDVGAATAAVGLVDYYDSD
jgi:coiled-coil domain-containing protein 130